MLPRFRQGVEVGSSATTKGDLRGILAFKMEIKFFFILKVVVVISTRSTTMIALGFNDIEVLLLALSLWHLDYFCNAGVVEVVWRKVIRSTMICRPREVKRNATSQNCLIVPKYSPYCRTTSCT